MHRTIPARRPPRVTGLTVLALVIAAAVTGAIAPLGSAPPRAHAQPRQLTEPSTGGRSADEWARALKDPRPDARDRAISALATAEPTDDTVDVLIALAPRWRLHDTLTAALAQAPDEILARLDERLASASAAERRGACDALALAGPRAAVAIEQLFDLASGTAGPSAESGAADGPDGSGQPAERIEPNDDPESPASRAQDAARRAIAGMGEPAVRRLVGALPHGQPLAERITAANLLAELGPVAAAALPALLTTIEDTRVAFDLRDAAARAVASIGPIGPASEETANRLIALVHQGRPPLWNGAADAIAAMGPRAAPLLPRLIELARDPDDVARGGRAAQIIGRMGLRDPDAVAALGALLKGGDDVVQADAAAALIRLRAGDRRTAEICIRRLDSKSKLERVRAARLVGAVGRKAQRLTRTLVAALDDPDAEVRTAVAIALWRIDGERAELERLGPELVGGMSSATGFHPASAIDALMARPRDTIPALVDALADPALADAATDVLVEIGDPACAAIAAAMEYTPKLKGLSVHESKSRLSRAAERAMTAFGDDALPHLIRAAEVARERSATDVDPNTIYTGHLAALGRLGPGAADATPELRKWTQLSAQHARLAASDAMRRIGTGANWALPDLLRLEPIVDEPYRESLLEAVAAVGVGDRRIHARMVERTSATRASLRAIAVTALGRQRASKRISIDALLPRLDDENEDVRVRAAAALSRLRPKEERLLPVLSAALLDGPSREFAADALTRLGAPGLAALEKGLRDDRAVLQVVSVSASIGKPGGPLLSAGLAHADPDVVLAALDGIVAGGARQPDVEELIRTRLIERSAEVRASAARALAVLRAPSPDTIRALAIACWDDELSVALAACRALHAVRSGHEARVAPLVALLERELDDGIARADVDTVAPVIETLGVVGHGSDAAQETLRRLLVAAEASRLFRLRRIVNDAL